jgi:RHS repeat-associated protein
MTDAKVIGAVSLALAVIAGVAGRSWGVTQVTTTTYQYNADGALTAVITEVDGQTQPTVYVTWDNFVPSTDDPTSGTVLAGNGNLRGIGPAPGGAYTTQFQYDQRNRLTSAVTAGQSVSYTYYASSHMASSTLGNGDSLQFYYDTAVNAEMMNLNQTSTGLWSSYLGGTTYLSDGTEQTLCQPRKDMAGVFDASQQSFTPVRYDPFGATASATDGSQSDYDLRRNFFYAVEYQDPTWDGYYLRARWYLPAYQTFLGRDPMDKVHRYSYAVGNPIGRVDPSGLRGIEAGARTFLRDLHAGGNGARGIASRFFLGGIIGITQIIANPSGYWHELVRDSHGLTAFLAIGVYVEIGTSGWGPFYDLAGSATTRFLTRHAIDLGIGASQSAFSSFRGRRFDSASFAQGIEYTAGGIFWARDLGGFGYKPFDMSADDVNVMVSKHVESTDNDVLVFRQRTTGLTQKTTPLAERFGVGNYHEGVFAVGRQGSWYGEIGLSDEGEYYWKTAWGNKPWSSNAKAQYQFVGKFRPDAVESAYLERGGLEARNAYHFEGPEGSVRAPEPRYNKLLNNCQQNAARLRQRIQFFQDHPAPPPEIEDLVPIGD